MKIEHMATILSIAGAILLAFGKPSLMVLCLVLQVLGGVLWCFYALRTSQKSLLVVNIAFIIIELVAIFNWKNM